MLMAFPGEIVLAAEKYDPSRINRFVIDLASAFHRFYNQCRIKGAEANVQQARLALCVAVKQTIANVLIPANTPAIVGESGICKGCGVATLSISYYDLGWQTGLMAYDIVVNGADIANMDICYAPNPVKLYNADICAQLGLTMPADYQPIQ